jgi:hypothetical protein
MFTNTRPNVALPKNAQPDYTHLWKKSSSLFLAVMFFAHGEKSGLHLSTVTVKTEA